MTQEHPITPPPELVEQWRTAPEYTTGKEMFTMVSVSTRRLQEVATQAARWGADQQLQLDVEQVNQAWQRGADHELEACCEWLVVNSWKTLDSRLRAARRPKPPSLKEQALDELQSSFGRGYLKKEGADTIRRALEQLDD